MYASDTPAAARNAMRPTTRDDVHPGTTVKIVSLATPAPEFSRSSAQPAASTGASIQLVLSIQLVFMQDPCLHDEGKMFALIAQQRKVFQRIAVNQDGVGKGACLQGAQFARQPQHVGANRGRRA